MKVRDWGLLVVLAVLVVYALVGRKVPPGELLSQLVRMSVGSPGAWGFTLKEFTPLLICGTGVLIALRAGLFNIGIEGQFMMGALFGTMAAIHTPGPLAIPVALVVGSLAGALWALPAGWIKAYRGGHEVITTIMLNEVAKQLSTALMAGPFKASGEAAPSTADVPASAHLPMLWEQPNINLGLLLGLLLLAGTLVWMRRTVRGYEHDTVGANPIAAAFAGINTKTVGLRAMVISGAVGGLGGVIQVLAYDHRCYEGYSAGFGFDALGVALLAGPVAWALLPAAFVFGALKTGIGALGALYEVPRGISFYLLGLTLIAFAALRYRSQREAA